MIPKLEGALSIDEFMPVSMVGCLYKIMSKVLVRHLRSVLGHVISETQYSFVESRSISDSLITANSAISWLKKKTGAFFKIDFNKAYDSVRWTFLGYMLRNMGFCSQIIRWLM